MCDILLNLVSDVKGSTYIEDTSVQGAEENIWPEEGWNNKRQEKTA
jgi:hypothetical protein